MNFGTEGIDSQVLVLNRQFRPIAVTKARRAFQMLFTGVVQALDEQLRAFDFSSWAALKAAIDDEVVHTSSLNLRVPRVVILQFYDRLPRRHVRFSRQNICFRDNFTCQYCGIQHPRGNLNLDHVVPRSQNGRSTWENVVCCCVPCNTRKGGRTPKQADMKLLSEPVRPFWWNSLQGEKKTAGHKILYKEWLPFVDGASASYWNAELED